MKIAFNQFYDKRIVYMYEHISNAIPRYKVCYKEDGIYKSRFIESTFPEYTKFAYTKKPKNWNLLNAKEKKSHDRYFQYNTKYIKRILVKLLIKHKLTKIQQEFCDILFRNFFEYEKEMTEYYNTNIIKDDNVPF